MGISDRRTSKILSLDEDPCTYKERVSVFRPFDKLGSTQDLMNIRLDSPDYSVGSRVRCHLLEEI